MGAVINNKDEHVIAVLNHQLRSAISTQARSKRLVCGRAIRFWVLY